MSFRKYNEGRHGDGSSSQPFIDPTSPDPVERVRQYEEDENLAKILQEYQAIDYMEQDPYLEESARVARRLQAEFDCEILTPPRFIESPSHNNTSGIVTSENDTDDVYPNDESLIDPELRDEAHRDLEHLESIEEVDEEAFDDIDDEENFGDDEEDEEDLDDIEDEEDIGDEEDEEIEDEDVDDDDEDDGDDDDELDDEEGEEGEVDRSRLLPDEINRLPTHISATPQSSRIETKMCQICMESYAKGDELRMLPCFHEFHTLCIDPWLLKSTTCPVCRIKVDLTGRVSSFF